MARAIAWSNFTKFIICRHSNTEKKRWLVGQSFGWSLAVMGAKLYNNIYAVEQLRHHMFSTQGDNEGALAVYDNEVC